MILNVLYAAHIKMLTFCNAGFYGCGLAKFYTSYSSWAEPITGSTMQVFLLHAFEECGLLGSLETCQ